MATHTDDFNKIKLYIESEFGKQPLLLNWDTALPLRALTAEVCSQWSIKTPDSYALKYTSSNQKYFLTEDTRKELKSGQLLHLSASPKKVAEEMRKYLRNPTDSNDQLLPLLQQNSKDPLFVTSFLAIDGIHFLMEAIQMEIINFSDVQPIKVS